MNAQHVTEEQALQKAQAFLNQKATKGGRRGAPLKMKQLENVAQNDAFYIFNAEQNGGYVIVSGDERTDEILGYSTEGNIDPQRMPENMKAWLEGYEKQIVSIPANARRAPSNVPLHPAVEPLITAKWNQFQPYNLQCPMQIPEGGTEPQHCVTGCVATALAQIMYYWKWPKDITTAIPAYDYGYVGWDEETQSGIYKYHEDELPPTTFEWDLMKDSYDWDDTGAEAQAVAKLMRYCGQAVTMDYGIWSSGAGVRAEPLIDYFGYNKDAKMVWRSANGTYYSNREWDDLIYGELEAKRPVWYVGYELSVGHAFVCDGYDGEGLFHFNWGWGGGGGYYRLSLSDSFCSSQYVVVGIQPPTSSDKVKPGYADKVYGNVNGENRNDNLWGVNAFFSNKTDTYLMIDCALGLLNDDGTVQVLTTLMERQLLEGNGSYVITDCRYFEGFYEEFFYLVQQYPTIPHFSDGTYKLVALWKDINETQWHYSGELSGDYSYCELTVNGNQRSLDYKYHSRSDDFRYSATIEPVGSLVVNEQQRLAIHCVNEGIDCQQDLYFFMSQTDEKGEAISRTTLYLDKDTEETVYLSFYPEQEGTYHVWVAEYRDGSNIVAQIDITISKPFELGIYPNYFDWSTMTMPVTVTNNDEVPYDREVAVRIYPNEDYGKDNAGQVFKSGKLHIEPGQSVDVNIDCPGLSIDNFYMADLMYYKNPDSDVMSIVSWMDRISDLTDSGVVNKDYFTVNGIQYVIADPERHYVFAGCTTDAPTQLTVPATVVSPKDGLSYAVKGIKPFFCGHNDVTTLSFSNGITTIDNLAVYKCESLETIVLPGSLKRIRSVMIYQCPNLKAIYSKAQEAPLVVGGSGVSSSLIWEEDNCDDVILYVPKGSRASYAKAWPQFTNIVEMDVEAMQPPTELKGDMNGDGKRSIVDVVILVNKIMEEKK
ncbi:MAG: C10 family peptidase [Bacteroidaceae bacterium]|nr:C10 family peptidase [Bacteroidaceae bacterium]